MPDLDTIEGSSMTSVKKADGTDDIRNVQLNEKISDTQYQILHPETDVDQVITTTEKRFVSDAEKALWNTASEVAELALHYVGAWDANGLYKKYDVVSRVYAIGGASETAANDSGSQNRTFYFVFVGEDGANVESGVAAKRNAIPTWTNYTSDNNPFPVAYNGWICLNHASYYAEKADRVSIISGSSSNNDLRIPFLSRDLREGYGTLAVGSTLTYKPSTGEFRVGDVSIITTNGISSVTANKFVGTADKATVAVDYEKTVTAEDGTISTTTANIDATFNDIQDILDGITDGTGVKLAGAFTVQKNGTTLATYNGQADKTANITFSTEEITDLVDASSKKIQDKWLPDYILGQMEYIGVWNASTGTITTDLRTPSGRAFRKGDYLIASANGNLNPSGTVQTKEFNESESTTFITGDWAVYNGTGWDKIDNTDAVRTVNGQIGDVKTYKGSWSASNVYYQGDIVKYDTDGCMYIAIQNVAAGTAFSTDNFAIFGRVYHAGTGLSLDDDTATFNHKVGNSTATTEDNKTNLSNDTVITIPSIELFGSADDNTGHVKSVVNKTYTISDTWRNVYVDGGEVLGVDNKDPLKFVDDEMVNIEWDTTNKQAKLFHTKSALGKAGAYDSATTINAADHSLVLGTKFTVPDFGWDEYGHLISQGETVYELPLGLVTHEHFKITDSGSIRSYTKAEWDALADQNRRFYDADASKSAMYFSSVFGANELKQKSKLEGNAWTRVIDESATLISGTKLDGVNNIVGTFSSNSFTLGDSGITRGVYSAIAVNEKGIATAGGQIVEFGASENANPSDLLVIGGLFFRQHSVNDSNGS